LITNSIDGNPKFRFNHYILLLTCEEQVELLDIMDGEESQETYYFAQSMSWYSFDRS